MPGLCGSRMPGPCQEDDTIRILRTRLCRMGTPARRLVRLIDGNQKGTDGQECPSYRVPGPKPLRRAGAGSSNRANVPVRLF